MISAELGPKTPHQALSCELSREGRKSAFVNPPLCAWDPAVAGVAAGTNSGPDFRAITDIRESVAGTFPQTLSHRREQSALTQRAPHTPSATQDPHPKPCSWH